MSAMQLALTGFGSGCAFAALCCSVTSGYILARRALDEV